MSTEFDPDEWLQVWTLTAEDALAFFNLHPRGCEVKVLKEGPETERERAKYKPEAKLFGIRANPAVPGAHTAPNAKKE